MEAYRPADADEENLSKDILVKWAQALSLNVQEDVIDRLLVIANSDAPSTDLMCALLGLEREEVTKSIPEQILSWLRARKTRKGSASCKAIDDLIALLESKNAISEGWARKAYRCASRSRPLSNIESQL